MIPELFNESIELLLCLIDVILVYRFSTIFLEKKPLSLPVFLLHSVLCAVVIFFVSFIMNDSALTVLALLIPIVVYVNLIFQGKPPFKFTVSLAYCLLLGVITVAVFSSATIIFSIATPAMLSDFSVWIALAMLIKIIVFSLIAFISRFWKIQEFTPFLTAKSTWYFFGLMLLVLLVFFESMFSGLNMNSAYFVQYMALVFAVFFAFAIILLVRYYRNREKLLETQVLLDGARIRQQAEIEETSHNLNFMKTKHDLKNHLIALRHLIDKADVEKSLDYINNLVLMDTFRTYVDSRNEIINAILNAKISYFPDIEFRVRLDTQDFPFKPHHLSVLLGNAVDNAIEAVQKLPPEQRKVAITLTENNQFGKIFIQNPYDGNMKTVNGKLYSLKRDNSMGLGLLSIESVIQECGGHMDYSFDDHQFRIVFLLEKA